MAPGKLPPLKSLVYFESAARLQSFTRAANELNVTQGAVSRQIRSLEEFLHKPLFQREKRQVFLNDDGHNFYLDIASLIQQLRDATNKLLAPSHHDQVTLVTSSALASMYLLPRIPEFRQLYKDIEIRIVARDSMPQLSGRKFDIALYYSREPFADHYCTPIFDEEIYPVCSPVYYEQHREQFLHPKGLCKNLIWLESDEDWINWPEWLTVMEIDVGEYENKLLVSHYPMVIQAAIAGQGVALAWKHLVDEELASGRLIRPTNLSLRTGSQFFLITPKRQLDPKVETLHHWLIDH